MLYERERERGCTVVAPTSAPLHALHWQSQQKFAKKLSKCVRTLTVLTTVDLYSGRVPVDESRKKKENYEPLMIVAPPIDQPEYQCQYQCAPRAVRSWTACEAFAGKILF